MKRYSILTYIINGYEEVKEVEDIDPEAEYILVTDDPKLTSNTWKVVYDNTLEGLPFDKCYYIRFHPFKYVHTNICIRIDGSIQVKHSLKVLVDKFEEGLYDICLMPHPFNDNFVDEYDSWVSVRNYPREQADKCLDYFKSHDYDLNYKGLFQLGLYIIRNNDLCNTINDETYECLMYLGDKGHPERIDQIPFSYIMNTKYSNIKVLPVSEQIIRSYYMQIYFHGDEHYQNLNSFYDYHNSDKHYMFNKLVDCMYLETPASSAKSREQELQNDIKDSQNTVMDLKRVNMDLNDQLSGYKLAYTEITQEYNKTKDAFIELTDNYNSIIGQFNELQNKYNRTLFIRIKRNLLKLFKKS